MSEMPRGLAEAVLYFPRWPSGPRFFVPDSRSAELRPWLTSLRKRVGVGYVEVGGVPVQDRGTGLLFGAESDPEMDRKFVEAFGFRTVDEEPRPAPLEIPAREDRAGRVGRPHKYPLKYLTHVGDSFLVVDGDLGKVQSAAANYRRKNHPDDDCDHRCVRVDRGVLVVLVRTASGRARNEVGD